MSSQPEDVKRKPRVRIFRLRPEGDKLLVFTDIARNAEEGDYFLFVSDEAFTVTIEEGAFTQQTFTQDFPCTGPLQVKCESGYSFTIKDANGEIINTNRIYPPGPIDGH